MRKGIVRVELSHVGEGHNGDYNPKDENDERLLRFSVLQKIDGRWEEVRDSSYCSNLPFTAPQERIDAFLAHIMEKVYQPITEGKSVKRICEGLT
jgi:hypothetical protein